MSITTWIRRRISSQFSLRLTLVLIVVLPLSLGLGLTSYAVLSAFERLTEDRMKEDVELVARALQPPIQRALQRGREGAVQEALRSAFDFNRVYGAYLYDREGQLLAAVGSANQTPDSSRLATLATDTTATGEYGELSGRSVYSYFVPFSTPAGRNAGLLQVVRRARDINQAVETVRWIAFGTFLATVLLVSGVVLWGHQMAVRAPLARLRRDMTKVEEGSRTHRTIPSGPAEIAALGQQFNTMVESIERAEHEIRDREAAQRELEQQLKRTEKLAAVGELSAGVAHELGSPLSVVDGTAQRALRHEDLPDAVVEALTNIRSEVQRMERIVHQLLDVGRRNPLQRRVVPAQQLAEIALESLHTIRSDAERIALDAPEASVSLAVDVGLMERVLVNLLRNALDAAPDSRVRLRWAVSGDEVVFAVEDGGPGIEDDVAERLFEPFFTTKAVGDGTGLGLAVVHGLVDAHGGTVEVDDSALGGACFRVRLPQSAPDAASSVPSTQA